MRNFRQPKEQTRVGKPSSSRKGVVWNKEKGFMEGRKEISYSPENTPELEHYHPLAKVSYGIRKKEFYGRSLRNFM